MFRRSAETSRKSERDRKEKSAERLINLRAVNLSAAELKEYTDYAGCFKIKKNPKNERKVAASISAELYYRQ